MYTADALVLKNTMQQLNHQPQQEGIGLKCQNYMPLSPPTGNTK